jgi:mono/diheme cytochrome c family protein
MCGNRLPQRSIPKLPAGTEISSHHAAKGGIEMAAHSPIGYFPSVKPATILRQNNHQPRKCQMKHSAWLGLLALVVSTHGTLAQQGPDNLTDQQKLGRQIFAQSCGVCHLPTSLGAKTYGPALNKEAGGGDDDVMREFMTNGTPRMPAFKYYLKPTDMDAIIAYVRTVPVQATPAGNAPRGNGGGE